MKFAAALLFALSALAQALEIRGTVVEYGPTTGIAGATVTLSEASTKGPDYSRRVIDSVLTDSQGRFSFKPGHYGDFYLDASMAGYSELPLGMLVSNARLRVTNDTPAPIPLSLARLGSLTGRFVDGNGKPIAELAVAVRSVTSRDAGVESVMTDESGSFVFPYLLPGSYVVRPLPVASSVVVLQPFTPAEADLVDEDYESTYWPGGTPDLFSTLPVNLTPAGTADLGTMSLRRVAYHRVRVSVRDTCTEGEQRSLYFFDVSPGGQGPSLEVPCAAEFLLRYVRPGSHSLALFSGKLQEVKKWAYANVFIASQNIAVPLFMAPPQVLEGRFSGAAKPTDFMIRTRVLDLVSPCCKDTKPDAQGRFTFPGAGWPRHVLAIEPLNPASYIKELRYNNQIVTDNVIELAPGATLAITTEEGAATIMGKIQEPRTGETVIFLTKWPRGSHPKALQPAPPFQQLALVAPDGTFQVPSLAPGEYRIVAIPFIRGANLAEAMLFDRVMLQASTITVERGATKTIELKLAEISN